MEQVSPQPISRPRGRLARKVLLLLLPLTFLPVLLTGAVIFIVVPRTAVFGQIQELIPFVVTILIVTLALSGIIVWLITTRLIVRPIDLLSDATRRFAEGEWDQRAHLQRDDEIGALAINFNQMADELTHLYQSLESLVEQRTEQVRTAAEVAQIATSAQSLDVLLSRTVGLIVERFGYYDSSVFLLDDAREYAVLRASAGSAQGVTRVRDFRLPVGSHSMVGWVTAQNLPRSAAEVTEDPYILKDETLPETRSKVVLPISFGEYVIGALDVQSLSPNAFGQDDINVLQTLANQVATAIRNMRLLEGTTVNLEEASLLYHASRKIAQAETSEGILRVVAEAMTDTSYASAVLLAEDNGLLILANTNPNPTMRSIDAPPLPSWLPVQPKEISALLPGSSPYLVEDVSAAENLPEALQPLLENWQCASLAILPMMRSGNTAAFLVMGAPKLGAFQATMIQPYASLAEMTATALEKVQALQDIQKRLAELQALSATSQIVAGRTNLNDLYRSLHSQVTEVIGNVHFLITLYNPDTGYIEVPYTYDLTSITTLPPFPIGSGLTSILIRTRKPLRIVENTEQRTRELGAITVGKTAKSWLGVPLVVGGEAIGAIIVQDTEHEHRFSENDESILSTLASQVGATIYNVRLLEQSRQSAERERQLNEIVAKIRSTTDIQTILATTATELGKMFGAKRSHIELGVKPVAGVALPENGHKNEEPRLGEDTGGYV